MFNIIWKSFYLAIWWIIMIIISIISFAINLKLSIEFIWWVKITLNKIVNESEIRQWFDEFFNEIWNKNYEIIISQINEKNQSIVLKFSFSSDSSVNETTSKIKQKMLDKKIIDSQDEIIEISVNWPTIWEYMKKAAIYAISFWILLMWIYILFSFSWVRSIISPLTFAIITIFTMIFDVCVSSWIYSIIMSNFSWFEIDSIFVIAILTIIWYSINDTIVIFDRIRDNILLNLNDLEKWKNNLENIIENSLWQTMSRSFWTWFSTFLAICFLFFFWSWVIKSFALIMWIWIIVWTYSSIFFAAPLCYIISAKKFWNK